MNEPQTVRQALEHFNHEFVSAWQMKHGSLPSVEHDSDWPSPCEQKEVSDSEFVSWKPVESLKALDFSNIESALSVNIHPDIQSYYTSFFSANLPAQTSDGQLELLFAWSPEDFERLQENILGHIWMKRKLKQPETVFFAVTDNDDVNLVIINETGEVWAEKVGKKPHRKIADSLVVFLQSIEPVV
ncbi:SecY-interacting protein [Endozoicomonas sp. OPT23]|uniref:SecY-interacting protein n=1 Tax=Endozoicomonas sp. OPT23 TaxID=2072845 RepID=UPI00129B24F4|nr:SecY-interacting protein [Endozoicomonas sp. OPT23]MRI34799.1 SecY-interacting protein [Endozoicomonas sp. OPT23]